MFILMRYKGAADMKENYIVHKINLTDDLKGKISKKLKRFDRLFPEDTDVIINASRIGNKEIVELTIFDKGTFYRAEQSSEDLLTSFDEAVDIIEGQIRKFKTKLEKRFRGNAVESFFDDDGDSEDEDINITRNKKFTYNPMSPEEAILQMNLLGHQFFIFNNLDTDNICVVYKRKNNEYGLIEQADE